MGAGQTKEKQLDRFGQLLSAEEKVAVSSSFQAIAGTSEVNFFIESQLQVGILCIEVYSEIMLRYLIAHQLYAWGVLDWGVGACSLNRANQLIMCSSYS